MNVVIGWPSELSVADLAALGVRRVSVGGALARSAWGGFMRAAKQIAAEWKLSTASRTPRRRKPRLVPKAQKDEL